MDKTLKYQDAIITLLREFAEFWKSFKGVWNRISIGSGQIIYRLG
jgi:hypothetical protein